MKKIILSAAVAAMAFSTSAMAADKGIDLDVSGQAVLYYETHNGNGTNDQGYFNNDSSTASAGLQFNIGSDLGNNFTLGSQITYIGSLGLEKGIVSGLKEGAGTNGSSTTDDLALTKMFIAKKIGNTTVKAGRQELPKSLSPLAFSEGWNVYKNTFDAVIAVNSDIPNTTLVGAFVSKGSGHSLGSMSQPAARMDETVNAALATTNASANVGGAALMLTAATTAIPMTTLTLSYYDLKKVGANLLGAGNAIGADAIWADAQIAPKDAPMGLKIGLQAGQISPDNNAWSDTKGFGAKVSAKVGAVGLKAIYTSVSDDANKYNVTIANTGTATKSPLYSQMMYNQRAIDYANDTVVVGASYDAGSIGTFAANYGMTTVNKDNDVNTGTTDQDYNELDLVYKTKAGGVQYFAIVAVRDWDNNIVMNTTTTANNTGMTKDTVVRFWGRYNF